jgi:hypothetical protein
MTGKGVYHRKWDRLYILSSIYCTPPFLSLSRYVYIYGVRSRHPDKAIHKSSNDVTVFLFSFLLSFRRLVTYSSNQIKREIDNTIGSYILYERDRDPFGSYVLWRWNKLIAALFSILFYREEQKYTILLKSKQFNEWQETFWENGTWKTVIDRVTCAQV